MKRLLVCGARTWTRCGVIYERLATWNEPYAAQVLIHGNADGADRIAALCAMALGINVDLPPSAALGRPFGGYSANWKKYGLAAGPNRNAQMLREGKPDAVWAFHDDIAYSKGTRNMVEQAVKAGVPVRLFHSPSVPFVWR